jgi:RNA polymerase sigma factor (sigma-70 family)
MLFWLISGPEKNTHQVGRNVTDTFAGLYEQYLPKVFNYVHYRIEDRSTAEDLTSVVFEKALTKYSSFNPEKASFSTWIFSIARNTLIDYYRAKGKELEIQKEAMLQASVPADSPEVDAVRAEEVRKLRACLSQLTRKEQDIITLKFSSDMNNREIARMLGLSESNVGTILCRTIRKLREDFAGWQK